MMEHDKLTGIERELVLQYLIDGNVPVTLTPIEEALSSDKEKTEGEIRSLTSQVFPVAIKGEHIKVKKVSPLPSQIRLNALQILKKIQITIFLL